ncbi:lipopolysaccharide biosynthesis protein [Nocardioides sp. Bht2]|uniref:lipopolysaccharide biosynthesis protein n=1 Tax=Nocardioides sp. Bht2 TaxID=3392297 RepID=UPI0039B56476
MSSSANRLPAWLHGAGSIAVAVALMNVATYAFTMVAARLLGPKEYGALAGLMATLLVIGVVQLGLQTTAARRIAATPEHTAQIRHSILRVGLRASLAIGALMVVLAPVVDRVLRLDDLPATLLVAVIAVPMTLMGAQAGILQGERRWLPLALLYVANGLPRIVLGVALLAWQPEVTTAMAAVALGQLAPVVVGWWALRDQEPTTGTSLDHSARSIMRETLLNSQALFAFFALSSLDIVVARNVLDSHEAGLYAGALILTKAVVFLPQFVVVLAFPAMSTPQSRRKALTTSLSVVTVLGGCVVLGGWLLDDLALVFIGGQEYVEVRDDLWAFAVLGTALSLLQLLVYSVVARQGRISIALVWVACVVIVVVGSTTTTVTGLLGVVVAVDLTLVALLFVLSLIRLGQKTEPART